MAGKQIVDCDLVHTDADERQLLTAIADIGMPSLLDLTATGINIGPMRSRDRCLLEAAEVKPSDGVNLGLDTDFIDSINKPK